MAEPTGTGGTGLQGFANRLATLNGGLTVDSPAELTWPAAFVFTAALNRRFPIVGLLGEPPILGTRDSNSVSHKTNAKAILRSGSSSALARPRLACQRRIPIPDERPRSRTHYAVIAGRRARSSGWPTRSVGETCPRSLRVDTAGHRVGRPPRPAWAVVDTGDMRVLFTTPAGLGHIHPSVPLAQAMVAGGHDVLWAAPRSSAARVEHAGFRTAAMPDAAASPANAMARYPELADLPVLERPGAMFGKLFGALAAPRMLEGLLPIALEWRPDLVVADAAEFAGPIVAAELGVPCVSRGFGPLLPETRVARAGEEVASLWRSQGLEPRPYGGMYDHLYLDIFPPTLQVSPADHIARRQPLRPVAYDGDIDGGVPMPGGPLDWPLVYVTMGTVFNDATPLRNAVDAVASLDARVLVTVGPAADPSVVGTQPSHVRVERYVPQTRVLADYDLVVSHAGSGTVLATLALGVPQLCLPQGADQFLNAQAVASAGAGISLLPDAATPEAITGALNRLLQEPSYRASAGTVSADIIAMPSPTDVSAVLELLT